MSSSVYQIDIATTSNKWSDHEWGKWDKMLSYDPSAYLHSKTIRAALDVEARYLQAVRWLDSRGEIVGIAQVEDTHAMSVSQGKFLKADKPFFKLAQTYLYRGDGVFQFDVRVLGTVLASGAHAYRFSEVISEKEKFKAKTSTICCYPTDEKFIDAHVSELISKIGKIKEKKLYFLLMDFLKKI